MPRPDVSQERIAQILDAAMTVFAREGFDKARMDVIADEAGLSKGTLYLYFESKDHLITSLLERFFLSALEHAQPLLESDTPASDRLLTLTASLTAEVEQMAALMSIGFEFYAIAAREVSVRAFLRTYFRQYTDLIASLIEQGMARGEFKTPDPRAAALALVALFEGLNLLYVVDPESICLPEHAEAAVHLFLKGIQA
ncbi:MAG TPA: TetR/AcrR family transcriptional regulator [Anaerolineales bacterium]|nr:TetR/AcrR family transcriptional regulator [Anaerolineales bacterium]